MTKLFCVASIQLRPIADHDMLTVGRSARDLLRKKIAPQQRGAKKNQMHNLACDDDTSRIEPLHKEVVYATHFIVTSC